MPTKNITIKSILLLAITLSYSAYAFSENRIGFVDIESALQKSRVGSSAQKKYEVEVEKKKKEIEEKQTRLKTLEEQFKAQRESLKFDVIAKKEEELLDLQKDLKRSLSDTQESLQRKNAQIVGDLVKRVRKVIADYGKDKGYTVILEKNGATLLYADSAIDLTDDIVERFDRAEFK